MKIELPNVEISEEEFRSIAKSNALFAAKTLLFGRLYFRHTSQPVRD